MEFRYSQICTTKEQSERLLTLGLKKETADMHHYQYVEGGRWNIEAHPSIAGYTNRLVPAWSLHRLIEMMPTIVNPVCDLFVSNKRVEYQMSEGRTTHIFAGENNVYDNIINCIEWLIKSDHFNKNYLDIH